MKVKATRAGTWPAGCHWSAGKVRDITLAKGDELPAWLAEVKATKKAKAKDVEKADDVG